MISAIDVSTASTCLTGVTCEYIVKNEENAFRQLRGAEQEMQLLPDTRGAQADFQHCLNFASFTCPEFVLPFENPLVLTFA